MKRFFEQLGIAVVLVAGLGGWVFAFDEVIRSNLVVLGTIEIHGGSAGALIFEGATEDAYETSVVVVDPTADRTITIPNSSFTLNAAGGLSGTTLASNVVTSSLTSVGTLGSLTVSGATTQTGAVAFGASNTYQVGDIIAADIADVTRYVQLPITGWVPCAGQGIWTTDNATGAEPNLTALNSGLAIVYDVDSAHVDTGEICTSFTVPSGYVSGGAVVGEMIGGTTTNVETFSCRVSQNGGAVGSANAGNLASSSAKQEVTSTPTVTYVIGDAIALICKQGNASADDAVKILSIAWSFTANQ